MSNTDVTEMLLQWLQPSCIVISVLEMIENEVILFKVGTVREKEKVFNLLERVVRRVTFDLPIIIGKAQRSVYSYMLTMKV
jgi:hypothetical protein